jgi:hypothetical protein
VDEEERARREAVRRAMAGEPVASIVAALGRSRRWVFKWLERYQPKRADRAGARSRAPGIVANKTMCCRYHGPHPSARCPVGRDVAQPVEQPFRKLPAFDPNGRQKKSGEISQGRAAGPIRHPELPFLSMRTPRRRQLVTPGARP